MIIGIDPSMTNTGLCILSQDGQFLGADQIASDPTAPIHIRCRGIAHNILAVCSRHEDCAWGVFCEEPGGDLKGNAGDLRALFWFIVDELCGWEHAVVNVYSISAKGLTKFITGNGNSKAGDKAYAISKEWMYLLPAEFHATDRTKPKGLMRWADLWDALALCNVGRQYLQLEEGTTAQQEALQKVKRIV